MAVAVVVVLAGPMQEWFQLKRSNHLAVVVVNRRDPPRAASKDGSK